MRRGRALAALAWAVALLPALAGCGGGGEGIDVRPFDCERDGRWRGDAVCYGPHRDGQRPGGAGPTAAQLREDLALMLPRWNLVRIYGASGFAATLLEIVRADSLDVQVMLGAWIAPDDSLANRREIEAAVALANAYPEIVTSVCVGNETQVDWSAHRCPPAVLIAALREVRARVAQPVTTADDFKYWILPESRAVAAEVDFVTTHAHPLWNGRQLDEALSWLEATMDEVRAAHPDRAVVLGETGWATSVAPVGEQAQLIKGAVGEAEQAAFLARVTPWAAARRLPVFWFEAFDENWKGGDHPDEVEKHWGLFRADRTPKAALAGGR